MTSGLDHDFSHGDAGDDDAFEAAHQAMRQAGARIAESNELPVPEWARVPLGRWRARMINVMNLVESAAHGMAVLDSTSVLLEVMFDPATFSPASEAEADHRAREIREMRTSARRAEGEVREGFPLLHVLGCVWTWASVEALLEDVLIAMLSHDAALATAEELRDIRIPWPIAATGDPEVLARSVYTELEHRRGSAFRGGVTRYEGLLSAVGLGGEVPDEVRRTVFELGNVRNVILHRGGIVDQVLLDQCPWIDGTVGQELRITHHRFEEYVFAVMHYVAIVRSRVSVRYPIESNAEGTP